MNKEANNKLEEMLNKMTNIELLVMYHASLKALLKRKINPLEEE